MSRPYVGPTEFAEVEKVLVALPAMEYPIASAGELIEKLGGDGARIPIEGVEVSPRRMVKYMPAWYFPIVDEANFIEKMAELVRLNRKPVNIPEELASLREQLPSLEFPIQNTEHLLDMVGPDTRYIFRGRPVSAREIMHRIPADVFPIDSQDDFEFKIGRLMGTRPLITGH